MARALAGIASGDDVDPQSDVATVGALPSVERAPTAEPSDNGSGGARRSRQKWIFVALGVFVVALVLAGIAFRLPPAPRPPGTAPPDAVPSQRLVVAMKTELGAGTVASESMEDLTYTLRDALVRALGSFEGLTSASTREVDAVSGPPSAVARTLGADEVLESTLHCRGPDCSLELRRVDGAHGRIVGHYRFDVPSAPLLDAARAVEIGVRREIYPRQKLRPGVSEIATTPEGFTTYVAIRRAFDQRPGIREAMVLREQLARLQERSPRFVEAAILEAQIAVFCYQETREPELLQLALERVARARTLAPANPQVLIQVAYVEIEGNRLEDAERTLDALEALAPGEVCIWDLRADLHAKRGETAAGLALAKMALERRESWERLYRHASLAKKLGEVELARESLARLLEQNPEHVFGLSLRAHLELVNGDPEKAVELYERLIRLASTPNRQTNLGVAHMLLGDYAAAAAAFESAVDAAPNNAAFLLNLADSRWLAGRRDESRDLYRRILPLKPSDASAQQLLWHAQALAHLGRDREAVAATREALGMAPESSGIAFEAALVFTLAGRPREALAHAARAVELGYERRWFDLPWFDELRAQPGFAAALGARNPRAS